eukprot:TRINITY_DN1715_c0_g1_i1.p1 TRINITY_DN1715_c0_g1~~TRINITY_DN1715_c0_g1_i1.p1  ORF type:complete len:1783 (-),score=555.37 TRINITY_DN1715_c0_g1_i1:358-5706(-)
MQLRHLKNVQPAQDAIMRITAMAFSPGPRQRLAVADSNRTVYIYDEFGNKEDKFHTKAFDPTAKAKTYMVKGLSWAPDGARLAVAQTDNCLFIYKISPDPSEKKAIWNRFAEKSPVDCCVWPNHRNNEVVYGLGDGKVRIGNCIKSGKAQTMYDAKSGCIAVAAKLDGSAVVTAHLDGSLWRFRFDDTGTARDVAYQKIATHPCVAYAVAWGETIVVAGPDMRVVFYDANGQILQHFDYSVTNDRREPTIACVNPSGYCCAIGSWDQYRLFNFNGRQKRWEEGGSKVIEHMGAVTALGWRHDGQRLAVGSMRGSVDLYDTCIRRYRYKGKFEFAYISHNNVVVKFVAGQKAGGGLVLQSQFLHEIIRVSVFQDRYIVSHTPTTLLLGDIIDEKLAEIPWTSGGTEKYVFDNPGVALVYNAGELSLVQYGVNEILGTVRTDHISPHLLSVRVVEAAPPPPGSAPGTTPKPKKVIAHLIDRQTVRVFDLVTGMALGSIHHIAKIDWLELNGRCSKLLFRDKNRQLFVYDLVSQQRTTLLNFCSYVQWVPDSDVVVAQNRGDLCVWYNIEAPERVWSIPIKGDVEQIERSNGRTKVTVDEGASVGYYYLDEALIEFGSAMEDRAFQRAMNLLDLIAVTPTTEAMWGALAKASLEAEELVVAERCFAALGDVARARSLMKINELALDAQAEMAKAGNDSYNGYSHFSVRAAIGILNSNFKQAEQILLDQGQNDEAFQMWVELRRPDRAVELALAKRMDGADGMKADYISKLESEHREEEAAEMYLADSKYKKAIELFLRGGMPARAAHVVLDHGVDVGKGLLEPIAAALAKAKMYERAGQFFEKLQYYDRAVEMYKRGHAFRPAVELSRKQFPDWVCRLEEQWGDWLVSQACHDQAVNHFVEAQANVKAVQAAIQARHWKAAIRIVEAMPPDDEITKRFFRLIASHFENSRMYADAEKFYLKCGEREAAVKMYTRTNQWEAAHKVAKTYMTEEEVKVLYIEQARQLEAAGHYKDAERLYCRVPQGWDQAIGMYRKARRYDDMIRLVQVYHPDLVTKTHQTLAHSLRREGQMKQAEQHFVAAKDWKTAVNMYCEANLWEDAIRVAKRNGGANASSLVILAWAVQLKGEAGVRLLQKFGLVERAIDYAVDLCHFDHAKEVAHMAMKSKLPYVHLKHAMFLEDDGKFKEAEEEFIRANKPREAVEMYVEEQDWVNAMRVADTYDPSAVADVYVAQARVAFERQDYHVAESFLLKAQRPDLLVKIYCDAKMWDEARKIAKEHCPERLADIVEKAVQGVEDPVEAGDMLLKEGEHFAQAIEKYLSATTEHVSDQEKLSEVWLKAVDVAANHAKDKLLATLRSASERLCGISHYQTAAKQWERFEFLKEAIDTYVRGGESLPESESAPLWDAAQRIADELSADASRRVTTARREFLERVGDGDRAFASGNVELALDLWSKANEWDKCMDLARKQVKETRLKYSALYVQHLVADGDYLSALEVTTEDGFHPSLVYFPIYQLLFYGVVNADDKDEEEGTQLWSNRNALWHIPMGVDVQRLRDHVKTFYDAIKAVGPSPELTECEKAWYCVYYHAMAETHKANGYPEMAARCLVAVCRYMPPMAADKAFYDAGMACRDVEWAGAAFVLLQRFLDVVETAEDAELSAADLEHGDFAKINIPQDFPLPRNRVVEKPAEESVRDWVLAASLNKGAEREFKTVQCPRCDRPMAEFSTQCMDCQAEFPMCVVTGGPILQERDVVHCKACNATADRDDWNRHIEKAKTCPMCQNQQAPNYG